MDEQMEQMIEKVQKLFNLAQNAGSDAEAFNAAQRAREIMQKYNLSMADVENFKGYEEDEVNIEWITILRNKIPDYASLLGMVCAKLYDCTCVQNRRDGEIHIEFVGVNADPIVAKWAYKYLGSYGKRKCRENGYKQRETAQYMFWYAQALWERVAAMKFMPQENALVPLKDVAIKDRIKKEYPHATTSRLKSQRYTEAGARGREDGKNVPINRPMETEERSSVSGQSALAC